MSTIRLNTIGLDGAVIKKGGSGGTPINNQEKVVDITENGTIEITYDAGFTGLSKVVVNINVQTGDKPLPYLTMVALEDNFTASLSGVDCEYCINGNDKSWVQLPKGTETAAIKSGDKVSFRATQDPVSITTALGTFSTSGSFNLEGDAASMVYSDLKDSHFKSLFQNSKVVDASKLVLPLVAASGQYSQFFRDCLDLIAAPELPSQDLTFGCYSFMFFNCESLKIAPTLPALTLQRNCYENMFRECRQLGYVKAMFLEHEEYGYTNFWMKDVPLTGTFVKNSKATWTTTGDNGVPSGWTIEYADA